MKKIRCRKTAVCLLSAVCMTANGIGGGIVQAVAGWKELQAGWQYFDQNDKLMTGWVKDADGAWYYIDPATGIMKTGWLQTADGIWYFLNPVSDGTKGKMMQGWQWIDGYCYYFDTSDGVSAGKMLAGGKTPDGFLVNGDGRWTDENGTVQYEKGKGITTVKSPAATIIRAGGSGGSSGGSSGGNSGGNPGNTPGGNSGDNSGNTPGGDQGGNSGSNPGGEVTDPDTPATPSEPGKPATPSEPGKPASPSVPEKPSTPSEPEKPERTVRSWERFETITVAYGTPVEALWEQLPTSVTLFLSDGEQVEEDIVDWSGDVDTENGGKTYSLTAEYELPFGVGGKKPKVTISIKVGKKPVESITATGYEALADVKTELSAEIGAVREKLPKSARLYLSNGKTASVQITGWNMDSVDLSQAGRYPAYAEYELPEGVDGSRPEISVFIEVEAGTELPEGASLYAWPNAYEAEAGSDVKVTLVSEQLTLEDLKQLSFYAGDTLISGTKLSEEKDEYDTEQLYLTIPYAAVQNVLDETRSVELTGKLTGLKDFTFTITWKAEQSSDITVKADQEAYYYQEDPVLTIENYDGASAVSILESGGYWGDTELSEGTDYTFDGSSGTITLRSKEVVDGDYYDPDYLYNEEDLELKIKVGDQTVEYTVHYNANPKLTIDDEDALKNLPREKETEIQIRTRNIAKDQLGNIQFFAGEDETPVSGTYFTDDQYYPNLHIPYASIKDAVDQAGNVTITAKLEHAKDLTFTLSFQLVNQFELTADKTDGYYYQEDTVLSVPEMKADAVISIIQKAQYSWESDKTLTEGTDYTIDRGAKTITLHTDQIFSSAFNVDTKAEFRVRMDEKTAAVEISYKKKKQLLFSEEDGAKWTDLVRGRSARIRVLLDNATLAEDQEALRLYIGDKELGSSEFSFETVTGQWGSKSIYIVIPFAVLSPYLNEAGEATITGKLFGAADQTAKLQYRTGEAAKLGLKADKESYYYSEDPRLAIENYDGTAEVTVFRVKADGKEQLTKDTQYRLDAETGVVLLDADTIFSETEQQTAQTASFGVTVGGQELPAVELQFKLPAQGKEITAEIYLEDPEDLSTDPAGYPLVAYRQYGSIRIDFTGEAFTKEFLEKNLTVEIRSEGGSRFQVSGPPSYANEAWYVSQNTVNGNTVTSVMVPVEQPEENGKERIRYQKKEDGSSPVTDLYLNIPGYGEKTLSIVVTAF